MNRSRDLRKSVFSPRVFIVGVKVLALASLANAFGAPFEEFAVENGGDGDGEEDREDEGGPRGGDLEKEVGAGGAAAEVGDFGSGVEGVEERGDGE